MSKRLPLIAGLITIALAIILGAMWALDWRYWQTTDDAYIEGDITNLSAKITAHVIEVAVADNQDVKAGDLLARLDPRDFEAAVAEATALVAARQAQLVQIQQRVAVQYATLEAARAGTAAAQADVRRALADLERTQRLVQEDFVSRQRFDAHAADAAKAKAGVSSTSAQVSAAELQLQVLDSERAIVNAQVDQARAQLDLAKSNLDATFIRAPQDGRIGNRAVRVGQLARAGSHLMSLVPLHNIWVDANFKETQLTHMQPGNRVEITIDAFPDVVLTGKVTGFSPASGSKFSLLPPENATGNFTKVVQRVPVRIALDPDHALSGKLLPGLSVIAKVDIRN